jgi:two-component system sensor histidine kinase CreC
MEHVECLPAYGHPLTLMVPALRAAFPGLSVIAEGCLQQPIRISADDALIVFGHLADNAARHNATTLRIPAARHDDTITCTVMNDGDAISENNRENIFTPFFTTRRETGGTGMGLEIVRSMPRAHRGSIRLLATDAGVAFEITLPADRA